eukprot:jgi/Mesen1/2144/ME000152S01235
MFSRKNKKKQLLAQLLEVEGGALKMEVSRRSSTTIARVAAQAVSGKLPREYISPLVHHALGVLHIRFSMLWEAASDCLAGVVGEYTSDTWHILMHHLEDQQNAVLRGEERAAAPGGDDDDSPATCQVAEEGTSAGTVLSLLLKTLQKMPKTAEAHSRQLAPLFLAFVGVAEHGHTGDRPLEVGPESGGGKEWRAALREWLSLLVQMKNARAFFQGPLLKSVIANRFLQDSDPAIQQLALECVLLWRDPFLAPYAEHLQRLIAYKSIREELATWSLSAEGGQVEAAHRAGLVPVLLRILLPKIMKRSGKLAGKAAAGVHRTAVLSFLGHLDASELAPFFALLLSPLSAAFAHPPPPYLSGSSSAGAGQPSYASCPSDEEGWQAALREGTNAQFVEFIDPEALWKVPHKRKMGFMHMAKDLLEVFGEGLLGPYLHAIAAVAVRCLEVCSGGRGEEGGEEEEGGKRAGGREEKGEGEGAAEGEAGKEEEDEEEVEDEEEGDEAEEGRPGGGPLRAARHDDAEAGDEEEDDEEEGKEEGEGKDGEEEEQEGRAVEGAADEEEEEEEEGDESRRSGKRGSGRRQVEAGAGHRDLRALCLRVTGVLLTKFPGLGYSPTFWDIFFGTVEPAIGRLGQEAGSSTTPGALLGCFLAMSRDRQLAPLLARHEALVPNLLAVLSARHAAPPVTASVLAAVENILELGERERADLAAQEGSKSWQDDVTTTTGAGADAGAGVAVGHAAERLGERFGIVEMVLLPHLPALLARLQDLLTLKHDQPSGRRGPPSSKRELRLLVRLSRYVTECHVAAQLVDVLRPFLRIRKRMDQEACGEVLRVLKELSPQLSPETAAACVPSLGPLLVSLSSRDAREALAQAIQALSSAYPPLSKVAGLIADLNAVSADVIDEYDYGRRLDAYAKIDDVLFRQLARPEASLLLCNAVHDMGEDDMSLRHSASHMLQLFLRFAAELPDAGGQDGRDVPGAENAEVAEEEGEGEGEEEEDGGEEAEREGASVERTGDESSGVAAGVALGEAGEKLTGKGGHAATAGAHLTVKGLVQRLLLPHVKNAVNTNNMAVRREWVALLREMVARFDGIASLREFRPLLSDDVEVDFFNNIVHLQVHRRIRAMARFRQVAASAPFTQGACMRVLVPVFEHSLFEARGDKEGNLVDAAVRTLAAIAGSLAWDPYYGLLMRFFRLLGGKGGEAHQRAIVRTMCAILDEFHFFVPEEEAQEQEQGGAAKPAAAAAGASAGAGAGAGVGAGAGAAAVGDVVAAAAAVASGGVVVAADVAKAGDVAHDAASSGAEGGGHAGAAGDAAGGNSAATLPAAASGAAGSTPAGRRVVPPAIQQALLRRIMPELSQLIVSDMDMANAPVALAVVKLLLLMPEPVMVVELPRVLQRIANLLKSRGQGVRDVARATLVAVGEALGAAYLHFTVDVLRSTLQRGFEVHVLGYTVHAVLYKVVPTLRPGEIDHCIDALMEVLENDIMGEVGAEKEVEAVAGRMKETKHQRSYESMRLLARAVTFRACAGALLRPVRANLGRSLDPKVRVKVEEMLRHLSAGVLANPTATPSDVLVFVHALVEDGVAGERAHARVLAEKKRAKVDERVYRLTAKPSLALPTSAAPGTRKKRGGEGEGEGGEEEEEGEEEEGAGGADGMHMELSAEAASADGWGGKRGAGRGGGGGRAGPKAVAPVLANGHLLTEFGLQLLHTLIKKGRVQVSASGGAPGGAGGGTMMAMLDPFVGLLHACLASKYDAVLAAAMRTLAQLLTLPLPSVPERAPGIMEQAFAIVHRSGRSASPMVQACLKMMTVLIRQSTSVKVSDNHVRALLQSGVFVDLEDSATRSTAFSLLRAIVGRRLLVPELYDLMTRVGELMVKSQAPPVRQLCSQILTQFLLDYPLGPRRLQQHLNFILSNLTYEYASGREAALEMLHAVITKFPLPVVEEQAEGMLLPLVTRLVSDPEASVRAMVGTTVKALMARVGARWQERILDFALKWCAGENLRLWRPAAQVSGFAVEVMPAAFGRRFDEWLPLAVGILRRAQLAWRAAEAEEAEGGSQEQDVEGSQVAPMWHEAYFFLVAMEKVFHKMPHVMLQEQLQEFWTLASDLLLHPHLWVRKVSTRLLGHYLAASPPLERATLQALAAAGTTQNLLHPGRVLLMSAVFCRVLGGEIVDAKLAEQAVKNLVHLAAALPLIALIETCEEGELPGVVGCEEGEGRELVQRAWALLGLRRNKRLHSSLLEARPPSSIGGREGQDEDEHGGEQGGVEGEEEEEEVEAGMGAGLSNGRSEAGLENGAANGVKATGGDALVGTSRSFALAALFRAMSKVALRVQSVQASAVLRWFAAMSSRLGAQHMAPYVPLVLVPIFRIVEGVAGKTVPEDLKQLGEEVMAHIREAVGVSTFVHMYNAARRDVRAQRETRKTAEKISALVDPERSAQKKRRLTEKRQATKRKKVEAYKRHRGDGGSFGGQPKKARS